MNRLKIFVVLGVLSMCANAAMAYSYSGYKWSRFPIVWYLDNSSYPLSNISRDQLRTALQQAFDAWQNARWNGRCTAVRFQFGGFVNAKGARRDGHNVVSFAYPPVYDGAPGSMGRTLILPDTNKTIQEADIVFPISQNVQFSVDPRSWQYDLVGIAMHQIGYMIGLADSTVQDATMAGAWPHAGDTSWRTLADDDEKAIVSLYPADCPGSQAEKAESVSSENAENEKPPFQCATTIPGQPSGSGSLFLLILITAGLMLTARSHRES